MKDSDTAFIGVFVVSIVCGSEMLQHLLHLQSMVQGRLPPLPACLCECNLHALYVAEHVQVSSFVSFLVMRPIIGSV